MTEDAQDAHDAQNAQISLVSMVKDNDLVTRLAGPISTVGTLAAVTTSVGLVQSNLLCAVKPLREHHILSMKIRIIVATELLIVATHDNFGVWCV